jgi:DNA-binding GntR family transcriptional regulator
MEKAATSPIRRELLKEKIAEAIRGWILDGTLRPGERVVELVAAARLGVSRAPLREALLLLERDGLVRTTPNRGAVVTKLAPADIREIFEIREALETLAARRLRAGLTPAKRARLVDALRDLEQAARARSLPRFSEADLRFHRALWDLAGNRHLAEVLDGVSARFFGYELIRDLPRAAAFRFDAMAREHRKLVQAVLEGSDRDVDAVFRRSFRVFLDYVLERFGA